MEGDDAIEEQVDDLKRLYEEAKRRSSQARNYGLSKTREENEAISSNKGDPRGVTLWGVFLRRAQEDKANGDWITFRDFFVPVKAGPFAGAESDHVQVLTFHTSSSPKATYKWIEPTTPGYRCRMYFGHAYDVVWGPFNPKASEAYRSCPYQKGDLVKLEGVKYRKTVSSKNGVESMRFEFTACKLSPVLRENLCSVIRQIPVRDKRADFLAPTREQEMQEDLVAVMSQKSLDDNAAIVASIRASKAAASAGAASAAAAGGDQGAKASNPLKTLKRGIRVYMIEVDNTGRRLEEAEGGWVLAAPESVKLRSGDGAFDCVGPDGTGKVRQMGGTRTGYVLGKHSPLMFAVGECDAGPDGKPVTRDQVAYVNLYSESCLWGVTFEDWKQIAPAVFQGMAGVLLCWGAEDLRDSQKVEAAEAANSPMRVEVKLAAAHLVADVRAHVRAMGYRAPGGLPELQAKGFFKRNPAMLQAYRNHVTGSAFEDVSPSQWERTTFTGTRVDLQSCIALDHVTGSIERAAQLSAAGTGGEEQPAEVEFWVMAPAACRSSDVQQKAESLDDYLNRERHPMWYADLPIMDDLTQEPILTAPATIYMMTADPTRNVSDYVDGGDGPSSKRAHIG